MNRRTTLPVGNSPQDALTASPLVTNFAAAADDWLCDGGSCVINWLARSREDGSLELLDASLSFGPLQIPAVENEFAVNCGSLSAGSRIFNHLPAATAIQHVQNAIQGFITVHGKRLVLPTSGTWDFHSENLYRDQWFSNLHLQVNGAQATPVPTTEFSTEDTALRAYDPPFDGVRELAQWLALADKRGSHAATSITIRINPPVDLHFEQSNFRAGQLNLSLLAHAKFRARQKLRVSVRGFPGDALKTRMQVADAIKWKRALPTGIKPGALTLQVPKSDSVLLMISIGTHTVRRQWLLDPDLASNTRYVAMQAFDRDLKQLRLALLENTDAARFENAVCALLYLLGFAAAPQLEKNAPDIILSSPAGGLAIVECTTRTSDLQAKVGKIVDRRRSLLLRLDAAGQRLPVQAFLVTAQARSAVAGSQKQLAQLDIQLLCREDLENGLGRVRIPGDPDKMLQESSQQIAQQKSGFS